MSRPPLSPQHHQRPPLRPLHLALLLLILTSATAAAQSLIGYDYDADRLYTYTRTSAWQRIKTFTNSSASEVTYVFTAEEEACFSWNVSRWILRRYGLGGTRASCSTAEYSRTVRVDPGESVSLYRQRGESEREYLLVKYAIYSDGSRRVVSTRTATRDEHWEDHRVR